MNSCLALAVARPDDFSRKPAPRPETKAQAPQPVAKEVKTAEGR